MGVTVPVDIRLSKVLEIVRPGIAVPIIVSVSVPITGEVSSHLTSMGMIDISASGLSPQIYGMAGAETIYAVANLPFVAMVHYDEPVTMQLPPNLNTALDTGTVEVTPTEIAAGMGADALYEAGYTGKGIKIAVIDTGCDAAHPFLAGATVDAVSMVPDEDANDYCGHGTHCAGIALGRHTAYKEKDLHGIAPDAELIVVKVLDKSGSGQTSWVCKGIEKAVELGANVISMSLGSVWDGGGVGPDAQLVNTVVFDHHIPVVVASGNSFLPGTVGSPGSAIGATTVGSVAMRVPSQYFISTFSSKGPLSNLQTKPNCAGFGGNLWSPKETILSSIAGSLAAGKKYMGLMGTSMATPGVAGAVALLLQAGMTTDRMYFEQLLAMTGLPVPHLQNNLDGWGTFDVGKMYANMSSGSLLNIDALKPLMMLDTLASLPAALPALLSPERQDRVSVRLPYMT